MRRSICVHERSIASRIFTERAFASSRCVVWRTKFAPIVTAASGARRSWQIADEERIATALLARRRGRGLFLRGLFRGGRGGGGLGLCGRGAASGTRGSRARALGGDPTALRTVAFQARGVAHVNSLNVRRLAKMSMRRKDARHRVAAARARRGPVKTSMKSTCLVRPGHLRYERTSCFCARSSAG